MDHHRCEARIASPGLSQGRNSAKSIDLSRHSRFCSAMLREEAQVGLFPIPDRSGFLVGVDFAPIRAVIRASGTDIRGSATGTTRA